MATRNKKTNVRPATDGAQEPTVCVVLLHPVRLSGESYAVGALLELSEADASDLVEAGFGRFSDTEQGAQ